MIRLNFGCGRQSRSLRLSQYRCADKTWRSHRSTSVLFRIPESKMDHCVTANEWASISSSSSWHYDYRAWYRWNKVQSETADFVPGAATWRSGRNTYIRAVFDSVLRYMKAWRHPRNRKYITYRIALIGGPSHDHKHVEKTLSNLDV